MQSWNFARFRCTAALILSISIHYTGTATSLEQKNTDPVRPCDSPPVGMSCVPGGVFLRGTNEGPTDTRPEQKVWVQTFYMDVNEVTYGEYQDCVKQGKCRKAGPNYRDFNAKDQPITGVNWYDAVSYCVVLGKHLPTEAEWEKAARGPAGEAFPWGDEPATCERAIIKDRRGRGCGVRKKGKHGEKGRTWSVGSRPVGRYGLYDMSGNSWEWVYDWYSKSYAQCGAKCAEPNPRGPCGGEEPCPGHNRRVVRGGSWYWEASMASGYYRRAHRPQNEPFHHFGFRCAASLREAETLQHRSAK